MAQGWKDDRFGERCNVRERAVAAIMDEICSKAPPWLERLPEIGLEPRRTRHLRATMEKRLRDLAG